MRRDAIFYQIFKRFPNVLVTIILIDKFSHLTREEVDMIVGHTLEDTRVYRDAKAEGLAEGRAAG